MSDPLHKKFGYSSENVASEQDERDRVWNLLKKDQASHGITPSAWFATRTAAMALQTPQHRKLFYRFSLLTRWLIPIPLAGVAALTFLVVHHTPQQSSAVLSASSEKEFEQHMELIADSD